VGYVEVELGAARVVCSDRHGGVSSSPYDAANLALHVGDDPRAVAENRQRLAAAADGLGDPTGWVWLDQVHSSVVVTARSPDDSAGVADAAVTAVAGLPVVAMVADCAPIALAAGRAVGVVHAGWRGLVAGVVEAAVTALRALDPAPDTAPVRALIGPCIRAERYEFGAAELDDVAARLGPEVRGRTAAGTPALDLAAGVRAALRRVDVTDVVDLDLCTASSPDYFSYRRDGTTGRQAMVVVRAP
jgi:YfiH family protein